MRRISQLLWVLGWTLVATPSWATVDSDGDGVLDEVERAWGLDPYSADSDDDLVDDLHELELRDGWPRDTDADDTIDALDTDDDGDGTPTRDEDRDGDGNPLNDDCDGDQVPDFRDYDDHDGPTGDADQDGMGNAAEEAAGSDPALADTDGDGREDGEESGDTDGDGVPDVLDEDDDGDGVLSRDETGDTDGDGVDDAEDPDDDGDGLPTVEEGAGDVDGDGTPNYLDGDSDGDGIPDAEEGADVDCDGLLDAFDTDVYNSECAWDVVVLGGRSCAVGAGGGAWLALVPLALARRRRES